MAKTLKTSGDYNIKAGAGSSGTNQIKLDAKTTRVTGDLVIDGDQVTQNVTNTTIEDQFLEINRNYSGAGTQDAGIVINQGTQDDAVFYFDAVSNEFRIGTSPRQIADGSTVAIDIDGGSFTLTNMKVATTPSDANHAASKAYVDAQVGGGFSLKVAGDDSAQVDVVTGNTLQFSGANGISTAATEPDTITISLGRDLNGIDTISTDRSNQDLTLTSNGTGAVVIDDVLSFSSMASDPTATAQTKVYNKTAGGGGTGLYFRNSNIGSGAVGELISKKKATAIAIALG
tara:strand:- start:725 stop:1585 length:861 start_codon:yes stop_codon:yes gene_type:complete